MPKFSKRLRKTRIGRRQLIQRAHMRNSGLQRRNKKTTASTAKEMSPAPKKKIYKPKMLLDLVVKEFLQREKVIGKQRLYNSPTRSKEESTKARERAEVPPAKENVAKDSTVGVNEPAEENMAIDNKSADKHIFDSISAESSRNKEDKEDAAATEQI